MKKTYLVSILAVLLILTFVLSSCSDKGTDDDIENDDGNAPFLIIDFQPSSVTDSSVTLRWTATGDDGNQGTVNHYDIRYSRFLLSPANWDQAIQVNNEPTPSLAGNLDSITISGLITDSMYYFGLNALDEAGNESGISICYAVCFENIVVSIPDTNLRTIIRTAISQPTGDIYRFELSQIDNLDANDKQISDLTGLEYCINLQNIYMSVNDVSDLTPLATLTSLLNIQFFQNNITDLTPLTNDTNLIILILHENNITDISPLSGLTNLHMLYLSSNNITDLTALVTDSGLGTNDTVYVESNPLTPDAINTQIPTLQSRGVTVIY